MCILKYKCKLLNFETGQTLENMFIIEYVSDKMLIVHYRLCKIIKL